jgi:membrane-associated protease RseP (regulator of RpoE activity)
VPVTLRALAGDQYDLSPSSTDVRGTLCATMPALLLLVPLIMEAFMGVVAVGGAAVEGGSQEPALIASIRCAVTDPVTYEVRECEPAAPQAIPTVKLGLLLTSDTPPVIFVVARGTPAAVAKLEEGDAVLSMDGQPVRSHADMVAILGTKRPGDVLRVEVERRGQRLTLEPTLGAP